MKRVLCLIGGLCLAALLTACKLAMQSDSLGSLDGATAAASAETFALGQGCAFDGRIYPLHTQTMAPDGCNRCTCLDAGGGALAWACTDRPCGSEAVVCQSNGMEYPSGSWRRLGDGCNDCQCSESGEWSCTEKACDTLASPSTSGSAKTYCLQNGTARPVGSHWRDRDGCNFCSCALGDDGRALAQCTLMFCNQPTVDTCEFNGKVYSENQVFSHECATCTCLAESQGTDIACTLAACE